MYGDYVFPTSTDSVSPAAGSGINCLSDDVSTSWNLDLGGLSATTTFFIELTEGCAEITVVKEDVAGEINTTVLSRGYNRACSGGGVPTDPTTVERAIKVQYNFL